MHALGALAAWASPDSFLALSPRYFWRYSRVTLRQTAPRSRYLAHLHSDPLKSVHDRDRVNTTREQDGSFRETEKGMNGELNQHIDQLRDMTTAQLQLKYRELFGQPSHSNHKDYLFRRVAWRMQAVAEGGLSERALAYALEIATEADLRLCAPKKPL